MLAMFYFNQNSTTTTQKESLSYYFDLAANLGLFKQLNQFLSVKLSAKGVDWRVLLQEGFLSVFNYFQRRPKI